MTTLEIVLLILGIAIFALSFFVFGGNSKQDLTEIREEVKEEVKQAVNVQMAEAGRQWEDTLREKAEDAVNNTERELSKVSNEKIMAVNEYSDTVLAEIDKNHKEAMFLYDMLNDKHRNIVALSEKTEASFDKTVGDTGDTVQTPEEEKTVGKNIDVATDYKEPDDIAEGTFETKKAVADESVADTVSKEKTKDNISSQMDISFMQDGGNNNEQILQLHKQGKSNVAIARELGLGVGEVKLVIDLFEGMK